MNPYFILFSGIFSTSFAAIFIRLADAPPLAIAFYRMAIASVLLIIPFLLWKQVKLYRLNKNDTLIIISGGFSLAMHFTLWITSLSMTTVASAVVLVSTTPIFVGIITHFILKEKLSIVMISGIFIALIGGIIITGFDFRSGNNNIKGDLLAVSGAIFSAIYFVIGRKIRQRLSLLPYITIVYSVSAVILLFICISAKIPFFNYTGKTYFYFFLLGLIPTIIGHSTINWALKYIRTTVVSISGLLEPIFSSILAAIILYELPPLSVISGGFLILSGIYFTIQAK